MVSGDGSDDTVGGDGGERSGEPADGPPRTRSTDPAVETSWLDRRIRPTGAGRPRLSTVLLVIVFVAVFVLYLILQPG
ncbi:hypothetical protein [Nocardia jinanensis]|uniref:Uncharacterized protein n=1 Tax=Nocardia jinanensis TaxID=382504 RepID=A0A917VR69_9NOCA|nr:hypothetical protein [Nocardia jinanensis]GGL09755.1 hypothetical protein GCM10011588_25200 [Nocardia jinanensis]